MSKQWKRPTLVVHLLRGSANKTGVSSCNALFGDAFYVIVNFCWIGKMLVCGFKTTSANHFAESSGLPTRLLMVSKCTGVQD